MIDRDASADRRGRLGGAASREAEVQQLRAGTREHHVAGLQIAVDDARAMRVVERVGDLAAVAQHLVGRQRAAREPIVQRLALEILHDDERSWPSCSPTSNSAQMCGWLSAEMARASVSKRARRSGRSASSGGSSLIATARSEPRVAGPVDLAHAAGADERQDFVRAESHAGRQGHGELLGADINRWAR